MQQNKDKWELLLEEKLAKLKQCQEKKQFSSCFECKDIFVCEIRKDYVNAVYESMNKGSGGGFEF